MKPESLMSCQMNETQATTRPLCRATKKSTNVSFQCRNCQRRFPSVVRLQRHLELVHKGAGKLLWCRKCSISFNEVSAFVQHSRTHRRDVEKSDERESLKATHDRQSPSVSNALSLDNLATDELKEEENFEDEHTVSSNDERNNEVCAPNVAAISTGHGPTDLSPLKDNNPKLSDVVNSKAISVALTQAETVSLHNRGVNGTAVSHGCQKSKANQPGATINLRKRKQSKFVLDQDHLRRSFLSMSDHPTMATIGLQNRAPTEGLGEVDMTPRSKVIKRASKIIRQAKRPRFQPTVEMLQTQCQSQNFGYSCSVNSRNSNLNINVPSSIKTINLSTDTRSNGSEREADNSEIMLYLRTVTAKLDAIIRHFNVPFSETGPRILTQQRSIVQSQRTRTRDQGEVEKRSEVTSDNLMPHILCKQSPSSDLEFLATKKGKSPILQSPVDTAISNAAKDGIIQYELPMPANSSLSEAKISDESFTEQPVFDMDVRLPEEIVADLHTKSLNRGNFAKHLVFQLFSPEERKGKNCFGRRAGLQSGPKAPLDPVRLQYVREKVFQYYPCEPDLEETVWRRQCVIAVDTALRGENRPQKKTFDVTGQHSSSDNQM